MKSNSASNTATKQNNPETEQSNKRGRFFVLPKIISDEDSIEYTNKLRQFTNHNSWIKRRRDQSFRIPKSIKFMKIKLEKGFLLNTLIMEFAKHAQEDIENDTENLTFKEWDILRKIARWDKISFKDAYASIDRLFNSFYIEPFIDIDLEITLFKNRAYIQVRPKATEYINKLKEIVYDNSWEKKRNLTFTVPKSIEFMKKIIEENSFDIDDMIVRFSKYARYDITNYAEYEPVNSTKTLTSQECEILNIIAEWDKIFFEEVCDSIDEVLSTYFGGASLRLSQNE